MNRNLPGPAWPLLDLRWMNDTHPALVILTWAAIMKAAGFLRGVEIDQESFLEASRSIAEPVRGALIRSMDDLIELAERTGRVLVFWGPRFALLPEEAALNTIGAPY
ncbi:MAG: hypothetical protein KatS3mg123_0259 [Burkholderiales bacterium]|jgi:hypothetical protein|nr:MAG: hypothetical protein KatS3mg123_0259 [Burkholderiales bacterium]